MIESNWMLFAGGIVGGVVALIHGVVMDRVIVRPIDRALSAGVRMNAGARGLITPLLQYSTFAWLIGGLAVMAVALTMGAEVRVAIGLLVGSSYLYAAVANLWMTRGKHPGGWLMVLAVGLIGVSLA